MTDEHKGPDTFALRESMAELAGERFKLTADPRFARAAGVLRGKRGGPPTLDDAEALEIAEALLASDAASSINDACVQTANAFSPTPLEIDAMIQRLRKKLRERLVITSHDQ